MIETGFLTTAHGVAMGTVAYMSPEQARGEELDTRTDLFSFGLVLYEMATGQQTFQGATTAVVFDAILNREPLAPVELNANVPLALERVIARAIEKDRSKRFDSAAEMRGALEGIRRERESSASGRAAVAPASKTPSSSSWPSAAVTVAAVLPKPPAPTTVPPASTKPATPAPAAARSLVPRTVAFAAGAAVVLAAVYVGFRAGTPAAVVPAPPPAPESVAQPAAPLEAPAVPSPVELAVATAPVTPVPPAGSATAPPPKAAPKPATAPAAAPAATPAPGTSVADDGAATLLKTAQAKIDAQLLSCELHVRHLLSMEDSEATRQACREFLQRYIAYIRPATREQVERANALLQSAEATVAPDSWGRPHAALEGILGKQLARNGKRGISHLRWSLGNLKELLGMSRSR